MSIVSICFKTPDALDYALEDVPEEERKAAEQVCSKFISYGECVTVDIDTETRTAEVRRV